MISVQFTISRRQTASPIYSVFLNIRSFWETGGYKKAVKDR